MSLEQVQNLRDNISNSKFNYITKGEHHIKDIYELTKKEYPSLCNDNFLCKDHCQTKHTDPKWHHAIRSKLHQFKLNGYVKRGDQRGLWIFE